MTEKVIGLKSKQKEVNMELMKGRMLIMQHMYHVSRTLLKHEHWRAYCEVAGNQVCH